ncbi:hypothetical protein RFI_28503 [Reticulomyxa filosa]|uniref:Uncharacterized protein n=1 Tax=Reticulomyxa filosa TaxID=46433 RepID=X6M7A6_RETFI|nr:hypothetical protein RFI_28503 [Reticulomyxa filosa]|eukprot:ETO08885.1 hypothetical protein RFI_28503 [Reticulomyxa filosa]
MFYKNKNEHKQQKKNLPPNTTQRNAFAYQTGAQPYHFDIATAYNHLYQHGVTQSCRAYDEDDDTAYAITDSEPEEEYETNSNLAPVNADYDAHSPLVEFDIGSITSPVCERANRGTDDKSHDTTPIGTATNISILSTEESHQGVEEASLGVLGNHNVDVTNEIVNAHTSDCVDNQSSASYSCSIQNEGQGIHSTN